jgi:hypothetical protein
VARRGRLAPAAALLVALSCAAPPRGAGDTTDGPDRLRVLVWNVWHGGNDVDRGPEKIRDLVVATGAEVVLLQESYDIDGERPTTGRWLAEELGWSAHQASSPHLCVLTSLEVEATFVHHDWHGLGARLVDDRGRALVAWSIWLDHRSYISRDLRDRPDIGDEELLAAEDVRSSRLPQALALLAALEEEGHLEAAVPVLVGGDWNTPSHLDWTEDTARVFRHRRALPLPVSLAMASAGFGDVFRAVHPEPVHHPGITWSPLFRVAGDGGDQGFERIDRLYLKNPGGPKDPEPSARPEPSAGPEGDAGWRLVPRAARVLPEVWEDGAIPVRERAFPSDHGAVLLELEWRRAEG